VIIGFFRILRTRSVQLVTYESSFKKELIFLGASFLGNGFQSRTQDTIGAAYKKFPNNSSQFISFQLAHNGFVFSLTCKNLLKEKSHMNKKILNIKYLSLHSFGN